MSYGSDNKMYICTIFTHPPPTVATTPYASDNASAIQYLVQCNMCDTVSLRYHLYLSSVSCALFR